MVEKKNKLVIIGTGETADIAYEYFTYDSTYQVVGFAVSSEYLDVDEFHGLPVVSLDEIQSKFPIGDHECYVAISYVKLNRIRKKLFQRVKALGYSCATYISSKAFVWRTANIGENVMIFENNVIQHGVTIGDNCILWSGNHIGHQSIISDHAYLSSHCVISGYCEIGESSFLGVNCTFNDHITLAADSIVGSGSLVVQSQKKAGCLLIGSPAKEANKTAYEAFEVQADE